MDWFQIGKGVNQGYILSPCLFNLSAEYIMWNAGLEEAQAGIKIAGKNINNFKYADDTTLKAHSKEELKRLLIKVKEESEKAVLKLNIQKTKIMASGPITSWEKDEGKDGNWQILFSWSPKSLQMVTTAMKLKDTCLLEERYDKPRQHIKKQRHYFANKCPSSQSSGFSNSQVGIWEFGLQGLQLVNPKGNQPWIFIGRADAEAETPILWKELRRKFSVMLFWGITFLCLNKWWINQ